MLSWPSVAIPPIPGNPNSQVQLYDSQSRSLKPTPLSSATTIYVCGITPYDATHMGHAATYVAFDLLIRSWIDMGKSVTYVQNITDIDDPLLERAKQQGIDWKDLAYREIALFREDMTALRVLPPSHYIGAVESIPLVVQAITKLEETGSVYLVDGDLYFDVHSDPEYGERSHFTIDEQLKVFAERGGDPARPGKRDPLDPLLWMRQREGEPGWDSPFGVGRPGWHIECCVIAQHFLGVDTMDVKGGGSDLIFPHHEMSAAQARTLTGKPFAHHYAHTGMIGLDGEKMSKSKGNLVFVSKLRSDGVDPMAIRLALMSGHYRDDRDWSPELLAKSQTRLARWRTALSRMGGASATQAVEQIRQALAEDLNSPKAIEVVDKWTEETLSRDWPENGELGYMSRALDAILGLAL